MDDTDHMDAEEYFNAFGVYAYTYQQDELDVLSERGFTRRHYMDLRHRVWILEDSEGTRFVVKSLPNDSRELIMIRKFSSHSLKSPQNHVVPVELVQCTSTVLAIMPHIRTVSRIWTPGLYFHVLFDVPDKIMEGMQFFHDRNTAFVDVATTNVLYSPDEQTRRQFKIPAESLFYIDFGACRPYPSGPGTGAILTDMRTGGGHYLASEGDDYLDPYAYDIYTLGYMLWDFMNHVRRLESRFIPSCMIDYCQTLAHKDPLRRPSIWRARRLFRGLRVWVNATSWLHSVLPDRWSGAITNGGWWMLSKCIP